MRQTLSRGVLAAAAASGILSLSCSSALADSHAVGGAQNSPGVLAGNNVQVPVEVPVNVCGNTVNGVALLNSATGNACANAASPTRGAGVTPSAGGSGTGSQAVGGAQDSPGVLAGNNVQVPVEVPVNVCGNTVGGVALLNSATGNACGNAASPTRGAGVTPSAGGSGTGSQAVGGAQGSPGVLAGNNVQVPVEVPVNVCGNSVNGVALLNSATDNGCGNDESAYGDTPVPSASVPPSPSGASTPTPPPTRVTETPRPTPSPTRSQTLPPAGEEQPGGPPQLAETGSKTLLATSAVSAALLTGGAMLYRRGRTASQR